MDDLQYGINIALSWLAAARLTGSDNCSTSQEEFPMRALLSAVVLMSATVSAFAIPTPVPEPESLSLLAVAAVALLVARRRK